jgi:hypothetical protein
VKAKKLWKARIALNVLIENVSKLSDVDIMLDGGTESSHVERIWTVAHVDCFQTSQLVVVLEDLAVGVVDKSRLIVGFEPTGDFWGHCWSHRWGG